MRMALSDFVWHAVPGCVILEAADGAEAMAAFNGHRPQLVLMDISLPDADGLELTYRIKETAPDTEIIVVSYLNSSAHVARAKWAGATAYVNKDRLLSDLVPAMSKCIERQAARGASRQESATLPASVEQRRTCGAGELS